MSDLFGALSIVAICSALAITYLTHVVWALNTLMSEHAANAAQITLSVLGILLPPFGVLHGFAIWMQ